MFDSIILNLKVISKIPKNGKLRNGTQGNLLILESEGYLQGLKRYLYGDSRSRAVDDILELITNVDSRINTSINSKFFNLKESDEYRLLISQMEQIYVELQHCIGGLDNLKKTYFDDVTTTSKIDIIIEKIKYIVSYIEIKNMF